MRKSVVVLFGLVGVLQGCAPLTFPPPDRSLTELTHFSERGVRVAVRRVELSVSSGVGLGEFPEQVRTGVATNVALAVREAGYELVAAPGQADVVIDATIKLTSGVTDLGSNSYFPTSTSEVRLSFQQGPPESFTIAVPAETGVDQRAGGPKHASRIAVGLVNAMTQRPSIVALRTQKARGAPPEVAVAPAAPTPSPKLSGAAAAEPSAFDVTTAAPQPTAMALLIGVETYRNLPAPTGARTDIRRMEAVMKKTFGLTPERVRVLTDENATRSDILASIGWLTSNVKAGGRAYFYFSGHGSPDPASGTAYLLPHEANAENLVASGLKLDNVLARLGETRAGEVVAIVDACFSGTGQRSVLPPGTRALTRTREPTAQSRVVLLSASAADETSGPAKAEQVGVFTKFLTEGLGRGTADINGDGQITAQELMDWVSPRVVRDAASQSRKQQPQATTGTNLETVVIGRGYP